jgi:hypothetical protein
MRLARLRKADFATPVVALFCDGAYYDVTELEARWYRRRAPLGGEFFERVVSRRAAGLREIHDRLLLGDRPTEARLTQGDYLPLPPTEVDRCAYFRIGPVPAGSAEPLVALGNPRSLVGDGSPAVYGGLGPAACEVGLGVVLADDLEAATPAEAEGAVLGYALLVNWHVASVGWPPPGCGFGVATHFGPDLVMLERGQALPSALSLEIAIGGERHGVVKDGVVKDGVVQDGVDQHGVAAEVCAVEPAEGLSYLSHRSRLRAGDVVGLGTLTTVSEVRFGARVEISCRIDGLASRPRLCVWAAPGVEPSDWRRD